MEQFNMFDIMTNEDKEKVKPLESNDWKWEFKDYPQKNKLKVFSCFACGGGSTMGYKLAGCNVLGCCEIDPRMNKIYVANHEPKYNYLMDIRDFNKQEHLPEELYNLDVLDGSPPCSTFSMAGQREESWGKEKKFREGQKEQTLDDLLFIFIDTVAKLRPKVVIMENVEGLLLGNAYKYVQEIHKRFNAIGYKVRCELLKGENMGVPQTRHRVFFIATRLNFNLFNIDLEFNYKPITYGEIKSGVGIGINKNSQVYKILLEATEKEQRISNVLLKKGEKEKCFGQKIAWEKNVLQTLTANLEYYRGKEKTRISINDIISAQTFPQDYNFLEKTYSNVGYICGMSVPPIMIKRIMTRIIESGIFDLEV